MSTRFYKTDRDKKIAGVCSGLSEITGLDVSIIRIIWAFLALGFGSGILLYILCALILPTQ